MMAVQGFESKTTIFNSDGSITENLLYVREPLKAGELKVVKVRLKERGEVEAVSVDVGVSVTLDWKPGGEYHPEL